MILPLYRTLTTVGRPLIRLYLAYRQAKGKEDRDRFAERLGRPGRARPEGSLIWVHAASVGESLSLLPLIEKLLSDNKKLTVLITTGTVTSARLMAERLPTRAFHQYVPVDCLAYVKPFLDHWQPDLVLWAESEFWPNMIIELHGHNIPMVLVNGRISPRSFAGWQRQPKLINRLLTSFKLCLGQTEEDAERLRSLGAPNATCLGNLKFSAPVLPVDNAELINLKSAIGTRPFWLAASTHPGEEDIIAQVQSSLRTTVPDVLCISVPRHPERGDAVCDIFNRAGLTTAQRSQTQPLTPQTNVYIADTLGELGLFFRLCDIVFMGKSLLADKARNGGQNPLEPARLNCAIVQGPHTMNFADITERLRAAQAFREVTDQQSFAAVLEDLLKNQSLCQQLAQEAKKVAESESGTLDRLSDAITPFLLAPSTQDTTNANA
jgi:3-deoxy-D-manno-octulosonic-acid transferase